MRGKWEVRIRGGGELGSRNEVESVRSGDEGQGLTQKVGMSAEGSPRKKGTAAETQSSSVYKVPFLCILCKGPF